MYRYLYIYIYIYIYRERERERKRVYFVTEFLRFSQEFKLGLIL